MSSSLSKPQIIQALRETLEAFPGETLTPDTLQDIWMRTAGKLARPPSSTPASSEGNGSSSWISLIDVTRDDAPPAGPGTENLPVLDPDRYVIRARIGAGGQGTIHDVLDKNLGRRVALKIMRSELAGSAAAADRFEREARITAQLSHAGIVPIYELGVTRGGVLAYTMKRVRGRSLRAILSSLKQARESDDPQARAVLRDFSRRRLLEILVAASHAVGYAHARGVIHRDIKPGNLMVGDYGEVLVLDWGIARVLGRTDEDPSEGAVKLPDWLKHATLQGTIKGTPGYMAPEQAHGDPDAQGTWTDVYALGLVLYEILCGEQARGDGDADHKLELARAGKVESPERRRRRRGLSVPPISPELEHICMKALHRTPGDRYPNAEALAHALQAYLDGEQRRDMAEAKAREADIKAALLKGFEEDIDVAKREARLLREAVEPWMDLERKRLVWEKEDLVQALEVRRDETLNQALALYTQALGDDPENQRARAGLAALYFDALVEAESWGRMRDARRYKAQVETLDDGRLREALSGDGRLILRSDPSSVKAWLYDLVDKDRRLVPSEGRLLGTTPITTALPMGRYLVVLRRTVGDEERRVAVPVFIHRLAHVDTLVQFYPNIPENFVLVPAGPFIYGGDRRAPGSGPRTTRTTDDFAIARFPVTCQEYLEFLESIETMEPGSALRRGPRVAVRSGHEPLWPRIEDGSLRIPKVDRLGGRWGPDMPVRCISRNDAEAYCLWRSAQDGRPYRLPTEVEWEKAGRGVDGRFFPWGHTFDASFCKMRDARPGPPVPEPIGAFPTDSSPYGVRDMAGGVVEWCAGPFDRHGVLGIQRGGFWMASEANCRLARRFGVFPDDPEPFCGFRLAFTPSW